MTATRVASFIIFLLLTAPVCLGASTSGGDAPIDTIDAGLVRVALAATGDPSPAELDGTKEAVLRRIDDVVRQLGPGKPSYRRARRLHRLLHRQFLLNYEDGADGIDRILESGAYNCLSATLFYGLVAERLGYRVRVIEYPGHLLLRIASKGRAIDIETTDPRGFDLTRLGPRYFNPADPSRAAAALERPAVPLLHRSRGGGYREITLAETLGFAWLNTAWRALDAGDPVKAAECVREARRHLPRTAGDDDDLRRLLSRAFREEYESGRFDNAYRVAAIDVGLFPSMTTSRDRILAAAVKRIELDCDEDRPAEAAHLLEDVNAVCDDTAAVARLSRRAQPLITAAAVRIGEWELAHGAAERYAAVEPDPVEAQRLMDWVETRSSASIEEAVAEQCPIEPAGGRDAVAVP